MTSTYDELKISNQPEAKRQAQAGLQGWGWHSLGAIFGLSGGIIAALMGSLFTAVTWFTGTGVSSSYVHTMGTILLCLTIPLLILGAHCLDLAEKRAEKSSSTGSG